MATQQEASAELAAAIDWWSAKRRDLATLLAHDDGVALTDKFLKVSAVLAALEATAKSTLGSTAAPAAAASAPAARARA